MPLKVFCFLLLLTLQSYGGFGYHITSQYERTQALNAAACQVYGSPQDVLNDGTSILLNFVIIEILFLLSTSSVIYFFIKHDFSDAVSASETYCFVKYIYRVYTKEWCGFKSQQGIYFSLYTGTTYIVSNGNCPSFSCATSSSLLMLNAGQRGQFPRGRRSRKRLSVCSVLRCPDL